MEADRRFISRIPRRGDPQRNRDSHRTDIRRGEDQRVERIHPYHRQLVRLRLVQLLMEIRYGRIPEGMGLPLIVYGIRRRVRDENIGSLENVAVQRRSELQIASRRPRIIRQSGILLPHGKRLGGCDRLLGVPGHGRGAIVIQQVGALDAQQGYPEDRRVPEDLERGQGPAASAEAPGANPPICLLSLLPLQTP